MHSQAVQWVDLPSQSLSEVQTEHWRKISIIRIRKVSQKKKRRKNSKSVLERVPALSSVS